jgi:hypothetical protein
MAGDVCKCDVCVCPPPIDHTGIDAATRIAVKRKIPVVIFVRSAEQFIVGSVTVRVDSMYGHPGPCVVFGVPSPDGHRYFKMTDEHSSAEDIQSQIAQRESEVKGPVAIPFSDPFSSSNQRGPVRPDDSRTNVGLRFHASHNCPQCGRTQTVISGRGPGNTHTHTCARCATTWYH